MKKTILFFMAAAGLLVSCDPIKEEKDLDLYTVTSSEIDNAISFTQTDAEGNVAADGNYFTFKTNPAVPVTIYNFLSTGAENMLAHGTSGSFVLKPKRGSDPNQKVYIRFIGSDNQPVEIDKTFNVYVQQELDPEIRLLASDAYGSKVWKWDSTAPDSVVWGNMGYCGGKGSDVGISSNGKWWGVKSEEDFLTQGDHAADGFIGDESLDATMVINDEGVIVCYDKDGNVIRQGTYKVENYDPSSLLKVLSSGLMRLTGKRMARILTLLSSTSATSQPKSSALFILTRANSVASATGAKLRSGTLQATQTLKVWLLATARMPRKTGLGILKQLTVSFGVTWDTAAAAVQT